MNAVVETGALHWRIHTRAENNGHSGCIYDSIECVTAVHFIFFLQKMCSTPRTKQPRVSRCVYLVSLSLSLPSIRSLRLMTNHLHKFNIQCELTGNDEHTHINTIYVHSAHCTKPTFVITIIVLFHFMWLCRYSVYLFVYEHCAECRSSIPWREYITME